MKLGCWCQEKKGIGLSRGGMVRRKQKQPLLFDDEFDRYIRVLNAISVELYLSLLTVFYSILEGTVFQKPVNGMLFAIIGLTQLRLFWFLYTGWHYRSFFLLRMHFILSLLCIIVIFTLCVLIGFVDIYVTGPFQHSSLRNHFQSHVLVALLSLVPFTIGFNASWRYYWEIKKEHKPLAR